MKIVPLGDQAVLIYLPDEGSAVRFTAAVRDANLSWLQDVVPAYASVGVFFDADQIGLSEVQEWLARNQAIDQASGPRERAVPDDLKSHGHEYPLTSHDTARDELAKAQPAHAGRSPERTFRIPVCYEFALDLPRVCEHTRLTPDEVIRLHTASSFTVYAIGFVPGFPYLGYLPSELCGVPRLASPRLRVEPGSVGLTGRQTGIYPLARPGGWNILGRTPLTIVDVADGFFPLSVGDTVQFERIDEKSYRELDGERLE